MKTGTVKNVAAFEKLVGICNDLGARYKPSKATLTPTALATLLVQAQQKLEAVNRARAIFTLVVNNRQDKFAGIATLVGRVVRALATSESSARNIEDAKILKRSLSSRSIPLPVSDRNDEPGKTRPYLISRLDYDSKVNTFARLLDLLKVCPTYNPHEADLKMASLREVLKQLQASNFEVLKANLGLTEARKERNRVMLGPGGLYETGTAVKEYLRSIAGVRSDITQGLGKLRLTA